MNTLTHYVVATGIVHKNGKYLIAKRAPHEKAFPNMWCVPGGKLGQKEYEENKKLTKDHWFYLLESLIKREIKEEVNLEIKNIKYLLDVCYLRSDGVPTLILSLYCDWKKGKVKLNKDLVDFAWVSVTDLKNYDLIEGIREQIEMVDKILHKKTKNVRWKGKYK